MLGLIWVLAPAMHIVVVLFMAILLATACSTAANRLEHHGIRRCATILLLYLLIVALLIGVVELLIPAIRSEIVVLRANLPAYEVQANDLLTRRPPSCSQASSTQSRHTLPTRSRAYGLASSRRLAQLSAPMCRQKPLTP